MKPSGPMILSRAFAPPLPRFDDDNDDNDDDNNDDDDNDEPRVAVTVTVMM